MVRRIDRFLPWLQVLIVHLLFLIFRDDNLGGQGIVHVRIEFLVFPACHKGDNVLNVFLFIAMVNGFESLQVIDGSEGIPDVQLLGEHSQRCLETLGNHEGLNA